LLTKYFVFLIIFTGVNFIKLKLQEITDAGPNVLTEAVANQFLNVITTHPDFAKDKDRVLKAFETVKNQVQMAPQFVSPNDVVNSKRYVRSQ